MIKLNIPSENLRRILEKTLSIVAEELELSPPALDRAIERLETTYQDKMVATIWEATDFELHLLDHQVKEEEATALARKAMINAERHFDPEVGLNWNTVFYHAVEELHETNSTC